MNTEAFLAVDSLLFVIATAFVGTRLFLERRSGHGLANFLSIFFVSLAWVCLAVDYSAGMWASHRIIVGRKYEGLSPPYFIKEFGVPLGEVTSILKTMTTTNAALITGIWAIKASFVSMYFNLDTRLTPILRRVLYLISVYVGTTFLVVLLSSFLWCRPYNLHWTMDLNRWCDEVLSTTWEALETSLNVSSFLLVIAFPITLLQTIRPERRDKQALGFLLSLGFLTSIVSLIRCIVVVTTVVSIPKTQLSISQTYITRIVLHLEFVCAIVAVSMPSVRAFLYRINRDDLHSTPTYGNDISAMGLIIMRRMSFEVHESQRTSTIELSPGTATVAGHGDSDTKGHVWIS